MKDEWIFLSPHLDDAVYSCGGLIASLTAGGQQVGVWTVCAGDPPGGPLTFFAWALHTRWRTGREAVGIRRLEDQRACKIVAARPRHFDLPDCIYRRDPQSGKAYYNSEGDIFGRPDAREVMAVPERFYKEMSPLINENLRLVLPLGVGSHVDHQLVRLLGERLSPAPWYYAEVPYVLDAELAWSALLPQPGRWRSYQISLKEIDKWIAAAAAYETQLSSFWKDKDQMAGSLKDFYERCGGIRLWQVDETAPEG